MPIDFEGGGGLFNGRKSFKTYEFEAGALATISYTVGSMTEETVYTVPAGKTFYISKIHLVNASAAGHNYHLKFNDLSVYYTQVADLSTTIINFESPIPLGSGLTIKITVIGTGAGTGSDFLYIAGWEQ